MEEKGEKKDADCQTALQCRPHFLYDDEVATVRTDEACQTEVVSCPNQTDSELFQMLQYVDPQSIESNALRQLIIPRKTKLQFKLPEAMSSMGLITGSEQFGESLSDYEHLNRSFRGSDTSNRVSESDQIELYSILKRPSQCLKSGRPPTEDSCQTNLMVAPHFLENDEQAFVISTQCTQTSVTFLPDDSMTTILPKLETRLLHEGIKQIPCNKENMVPGSVLDFIKNLLNQVENKNASLEIFQKTFTRNENPFQNKSESEPAILRNPLAYDDIKYVHDTNSSYDLKQMEEEDENCACLVQFVPDVPQPKSIRVTELIEKESCYPLENTNNKLCLKGSHQTVKYILNEIVDNSDTVIPARDATSIQNLLADLIDSVTSFTDIKEILPQISLPTRSPCQCKVPQIKINIIMNKTSETNLNIHATASIRFENDNFTENHKCLTEKPLIYPSKSKSTKCCMQNISVNVVNNSDEPATYELEPVVKQSCVMNNKNEIVSCMEDTSQKAIEYREKQPEKDNSNKTAPENTDIIKLCICKRDPEKKNDSLALCFCKKDGKNEAKSKSMCACQQHECNTIVASNVDTKGLDIFGKEPPEKDTEDYNTELEPIRICACKNAQFNQNEPFQKCTCKKDETNMCCGTRNNDNGKEGIDETTFPTKKSVAFTENAIVGYQKPVGCSIVTPGRCEDAPNKTLEQNIIAEENFIVATKHSKIINQMSTISNSKYVCVTSSKVIETTTSVFGSGEDESISECTSARPGPQIENVCRTTTYSTKNNKSKTMSCPRNNKETFKCAPGSSKPVKNVTIGIGPVRPDENRKGCVAIPVRVVLNRRSESDTVVHAVNDRHYSFHCDDNNCASRKPQQSVIIQREPSLLDISAVQSEVVSPNVQGSLKYCGVTRCQENVALTELDVDQQDLSESVAEDKCTMETCVHWSKPNKEASFGIPWEHVLIQGEVEAEPVTEESSMELLPIQFVDELIADSDSDVQVGCCGGSKPKAKPTPIPVTMAEPVTPAEPEQKIDLIYSHNPCPVIEPYISALLQEGDTDGSVGICLEDTIMPLDVEIRAGAIVESVESLPQQQSLAPIVGSFNVTPSRPQMPERIHKRINLRESVRFAEHERLIEKRSTRPILTLAGRPITSGAGSIFTLYRSDSYIFPSTTIAPVEEKYSTFLAVVDFNEEVFPLKSTISRNKRPNNTPKTAHFAMQDTTMIFQKDRAIDFETNSNNEVEILQETQSLTVAQVVRSITSSEIPQRPTIIESNRSSSDEVVFSHTILLTESLDLLMPDENEQTCGPCNLKALPDTCQNETPKDKENVCPPCDATVPAKQKSTCCLVRKPNSRRNLDVCEPCKMVVRKDSATSVVPKRDPVTLALMACEKELKPVRQALNKVRVKLRNMNMPELDYLFKNETDINSYPRIESTPMYSTGYNPASYSYPTSSYSRASYDPIMTNYDDACNCCYCSYGFDYNNQPRETYSAYNSNASMRMNDIPNYYSTTPKRSKVMFDFGNLPYKTEPSVSIMHENRRIFNYTESQEDCKFNFDSDTEDVSTCSSRTQRKKKKSTKRNKPAGSRCTSCNNCPFFEALKAVLSVDSTNCKKKSKTVRARTGKSKAVYTTDKIRLRFKLNQT